MTETLCVLTDKDGVASGPVHHPALPDVLNRRVWPPLKWPALCGDTGLVYVREGLPGRVEECFTCKCLKMRGESRYRPSAVRYGDNADARLLARRRTWRESKRRNRKIKHPETLICAFCGREFQPNPYTVNTQLYCSERCRNACYYRRRKEREAA